MSWLEDCDCWERSGDRARDFHGEHCARVNSGVVVAARVVPASRRRSFEGVSERVRIIRDGPQWVVVRRGLWLCWCMDSASAYIDDESATEAWWQVSETEREAIDFAWYGARDTGEQSRRAEFATLRGLAPAWHALYLSSRSERVDTGVVRTLPFIPRPNY